MIGDLFDSPLKLAIIAVLIIVLFGARKLPEAARSLGKSMRILKTEVQGLHEDERRPGRALPGHPGRAGPAAGPRRARRRPGRAGADRRAEQAARRPPAVGQHVGQRAGQVGPPAPNLTPNPSGNTRSWHRSLPPSGVPASSAHATCASSGRPNPEGRMPLFDHLRELRNRVVKVALAVIVGAGVSWAFYQPDLGLHPAALLPGRRVLQGERTRSLAHTQRRDGRLLPAPEGRHHRRGRSSPARSGCTSSGPSSLPGCTRGRSAGRTCSSAARFRCSASGASSPSWR